MAKAKITTKSGLTVQVEGSPAEILTVVQELKNREEAAKGKPDGKRKTGPTQLVDLIDLLIKEGFFKGKKRDLGDVKTALAELGYRYPVTSLSGPLLRRVQGRQLKRKKEENPKRWVYWT